MRASPLNALPVVLAALLANAVAASAEDGVSADKIVFGQATALEGPASALGQGMKMGLEAAFAELAGVPVENARLLINDPGRRGLKSLYAQSGLKPELYPAFRVAIDVARETPFDGGENDRERHRRRCLERILTQFEEIGAEDLDYLLTKLQEKAA